MRFFHLGDLHFGKTVHNVSMGDSDQPFWIEQFLKKVDENDPDAIVIAGDIYDKGTPTLEAVGLLNGFLTELVKRDKYVFIVPGNHDSEVRLSFAKDILKDKKLYIAGPLTKELTHIDLDKDGVPVTFWLMPYLTPRTVINVLGKEEYCYYDYGSAVRDLLAVQPLDRSRCNVLVAHQNVVDGEKKPEHSESETIIGGSGEVGADCFADFDYVALGHIHNAQAIGRDTVRYAGCPLYYDFSEGEELTAGKSTRAACDKRLTLVEIAGKGQVTPHKIDIDLLHGMISLHDTVEELLRYGRELTAEEKKRNYYQLRITDKGISAGAGAQLNEAFSWTEDNGTHRAVINIGHEPPVEVGSSEAGVRSAGGSFKKLSIDKQFADFFSHGGQSELMDGVQEAVVQKIIEQQENGSGEYFSSENRERQADRMDGEVKALLDFLFEKIGEAGK